jgi:hypothetical protein
MITITGTVGATGYLVTGMPVTTATQTVLKITFECGTAGTNVALCAGTIAEFTAGAVGLRLSDSGGPGFRFLTIIGTEQILGKVIYVLRMVGTAPAQFTLTID